MVYNKAKIDKIFEIVHGKKPSAAMMAHRGMKKFIGGYVEWLVKKGYKKYKEMI